METTTDETIVCDRPPQYREQESSGRTHMAHQHSPRFLQIVEDAKKRVRETTIEDVKERMDQGEEFLLVDVREESEFAKDHLPGAIHLGKGIIERDIEARVPELDTEMILYCGGGFNIAFDDA